MSHGLRGLESGRMSRERIGLRSGTANVVSSDAVRLAAVGVLAALAMALVHLSLRVPGHAILKPLLPLVLGTALVPRRNAGALVSLGALATAGVLAAGAWGQIQASALTSLVLLGPAFDLAARGLHSKRVLLVRFALAGLLANLAALGVKLAASAFGLEGGGGRGFAALWPVSLLTFVGCGVAAGLVGAAISIPLARRRDSRGEP